MIDGDLFRLLRFYAQKLQGLTVQGRKVGVVILGRDGEQDKFLLHAAQRTLTKQQPVQQSDLRVYEIRPKQLRAINPRRQTRSEEHTSELQSRLHPVCRL